MFCYKCGAQLSDDAVFCYKCGTNVSRVSVLQEGSEKLQRESSTEKELDQAALKIYLRDLLTLECITQKQMNRLERLDYNIKYPHKYVYKIDDFFKTYDSRNASRFCFHLRYDGQKYYIAYKYNNFNGQYDGIYREERLSRENDWRWRSIETVRSALEGSSAWKNIDWRPGFFDRMEDREQAKKKFFKVYEEFKANAPAIYQQYVNAEQENRAIRPKVAEELSDAKKLLDQSYSLNIIPGQYRNIYAVYYLYDFISTSNQPLSTALLHLDLKEIKEKLDKVIEQQEEIIINQSILMSQNQQMMEQNQMQLNQLASIEKNTRRAAEYSEIAAHNSEICAWIGAANFLKE